MSQLVNNIFESITNSTNPQYAGARPQVVYTPSVQPVYTPPPPISMPTYVPPTIYPLPTTMYTPSSLRTHFQPLNSNYNNSFYLI